MKWLELNSRKAHAQASRDNQSLECGVRGGRLECC
jgi:hypothetical protein